MNEQPTRLTATETAARLGVKSATLYAYVSRGLLSRERGAHGSTFDPIEVERFAATRRRGSADNPAVVIKDGRPTGGPLMTIDTDIALIEDGELYYRGRSAAELATTSTFESVCGWLWTGQWDPSLRFRPLPGAVAAVRPVLLALPPATPLTDRIRIVVPILAGADPLRDVLERVSVAHRAGALISTAAEVIGVRDDHEHGREEAIPGQARDPRVAQAPVQPSSVADLLARALAPHADDHEALVGVVNAALVMLVDHDLAVSTLAARAAASARANPYAVVISGLGALDSALHGNASRAAYRMLAAVAAGESPRQVIATTIASGRGGVPGFGHRIYTDVDPRAELIMELLGRLPDSESSLAAADALTAVVGDHGGSFRNVDLALAALTLAARMPEEAGEVIFALARTGGWIAHAIDEYAQPPLRLRPVGHYVGP
ncbi:MAG TPA: citrate synthase [Microlunatus sp.]